MFSTEHIINFFHFEITRNLVKKIVFQCFLFVWQYHSCSDLFLQGQELVTGDIPCNEKTSVVNDKLQTLLFSLSNSRRHSANADVIADVKSKITVSRQHFFGDVIFCATWKGKFKTTKIRLEKNPYTQANTCLLHISRNFKILNI